MESFKTLLDNNRKWASEMVAEDPEFFSRTEGGQTPQFLIVGCSDSRVPLERMTGAMPGEIFVHRNIGNQVWSTDINVLSVLTYAVNVLDVPHVVVCGHTNCGALKAALGPETNGLLDHWLSHVRNTIRWHRDELDVIPELPDRVSKLADLNVMQQLGILSRTPVIRDAWARGRRPMLHGWVYDIANGLIHTVVDQIDSEEKAKQALPTN